VKELSKVKEDYEQSVDDPDMGLSLQVEIKKKDSTNNNLWVEINLESIFGSTIR
jgi:hypothetical protein